MSLSPQSKKVLNNLLENLEENSGQLQNLLQDFVTKIVSATRKWMDDSSEQNLTFKEAVATITGASVTLFEHIDMITGQLHQPLDPDDESVAPETKPIKPAQGVPYSADVKSMENVEESLTNLTNRFDQLESRFLSLPNTKHLIEEEMLSFKQLRENFESELVLKIETLGKLSCAQDDKIIDLMKEIKNLKEKESATNKQIEKLTHDTKENEKIFLKIDEELRRNCDKMEIMAKDVKNQSKLIATLEEEHIKNIEHSASTLKNIGSKYGVMCKILQKRLAPVEKLMLNANQTTVKNEPNLQMVESSDKFLNLRFDKTWQGQLKHSKIGFKAYNGVFQYGLICFAPSTISFKHVECYIDNIIDKTSARYTIPVDGIYTITLAMKTNADVQVKCFVQNYREGRPQELDPCKVQCSGIGSTASQTWAVLLKTGDTISALGLGLEQEQKQKQKQNEIFDYEDWQEAQWNDEPQWNDEAECTFFSCFLETAL